MHCVTQFGINRAGESSCLEAVGKAYDFKADYCRLKHVEQTKNFRIKLIIRNCSSQWLLTYCNMMHGTHNIKLIKRGDTETIS